jgi:hypothetical protein
VDPNAQANPPRPVAHGVPWNAAPAVGNPVTTPSAMTTAPAVPSGVRMAIALPRQAGLHAPAAPAATGLRETVPTAADHVPMTVATDLHAPADPAATGPTAADRVPMTVATALPRQAGLRAPADPAATVPTAADPVPMTAVIALPWQAGLRALPAPATTALRVTVLPRQAGPIEADPARMTVVIVLHVRAAQVVTGRPVIGPIEVDPARMTVAIVLPAPAAPIVIDPARRAGRPVIDRTAAAHAPMIGANALHAPAARTATGLPVIGRTAVVAMAQAVEAMVASPRVRVDVPNVHLAVAVMIAVQGPTASVHRVRPRMSAATARTTRTPASPTARANAASASACRTPTTKGWSD